MAEPALPEIDFMTGKPLGGAALLNPETNLPQVDFMTGKPLGHSKTRGVSSADAQGIFGDEKTGGYKEDLSAFTEYGVPLGRNLDFVELRARNQSTAEKWGHGLAKAGVTAIGAVAENTVGVIAGLGSLATGGAYWDNSVGRSIDGMNDYMREYMPNYLTKEEQNMGTWQKMGTANFWGDTVANGLGYSIGSLATMWLTGGGGLVTKGISATAKGLGIYNATKALINGSSLANKLSKGGNIAGRLRKASQMVEAGAMMSLAEASVEARETQHTVFSDLKAKYMADNNLKSEGEIPTTELVDMENSSYSAGNANFGMQMPVLMGTNLLMFGKMVSGFGGATARNADVAWGATSKKAISNLAERSIWRKGLSRIAPIGRSGLEEATQEGFQFASNIWSSTYHTDKYHNGGQVDLMKAFTSGLSDTFGTQEGREAMLVGFLTGGLMGGGGSIVSGEYSGREKAAEELATLINGGYFNNVLAAAETGNASSSALKRMQVALEKGDIKTFKDEQLKLISYQAMQALNQGGFDVMMEQLEDSKGLDADQFMEKFGYQTTDSAGNALTLEDQTGGKNQSEVVEGVKDKLKSFQETYNNVNERFPLPDKTSGLPRMMMSEENRAAEDAVHQDQANLRAELILSGAGVKDRNRRMASIQKLMQRSVDQSVGATEGTDVSSNINFALRDQEGAQSADAENYNPVDQYNNTGAALQKIADDVRKTDPVAADKLVKYASDYMALMADNNVAIDRYNKLSSDSYSQGVFQREVAKNQALQKAKVVTAEVDKAITDAKTSADLISMSPTVDVTSPEDKIRLKEQFDKLQSEEAAVARKYWDEHKGKPLKDQLEALKAIDTENLTPKEKAGIELAISYVERSLAAENEGQPTPSAEEAVDTAEENAAEEEVEDALKPEKLGGVEAVSDNGREFSIDGKKFFNKRTNPLDAINRTQEGRIKSVQLTDEEGVRHTIWGPQERVDTIAYNILMSEVLMSEGVPTQERENILAEKVAVEAEAKQRKASTGKHGIKSSESLRQEIYEIERTLDAALDVYDSLRASYVQEAGATKKDLKNDPKLKSLSKELTALRRQIRERSKILKLRQEPVIATSQEILKAETKAMEEIKALQKELDSAGRDANSLDQDIADTEAKISSLQSASTTEKATDEWLEARREAEGDLVAQNELIEELRTKVTALTAQIKVRDNQLEKSNNEKEAANDPGTGEESQPEAAGQPEGQPNQREDIDPGERVEEEESPIVEEEPVDENDDTWADVVPENNAELAAEQSINNEAAPARENDGDPLTPGKPATEEQLSLFEDEAPTGPGFGEALEAAADDISRGRPPGESEVELPKVKIGEPTVDVNIGPDTGIFQIKQDWGLGDFITVGDISVSFPGQFKAGKIPEGKGEAFIAGVEIYEESNKGKKLGLSAYVELGKYMESKGYTLSSGINPSEAAVRVWESLVRRGFAVNTNGKYIFKTSQPTSTQEIQYKNNTYVVDINNFTVTNKKTGKVINTTSPIGAAVMDMVDFDALEEPYAQPTSEGKTVPTGETLGVKKANDDHVVNIAPEGSKSKFIVPVSENGTPETSVDTVNGEPILIDRTVLNSPGVIGAEVEFEIITNDWFASNFGEFDNETGKNWEVVPVYFKIGGKIVGKLQSADKSTNAADRKSIVDRLRAGENVTVQVQNVAAGANNFNHSRVSGTNEVFFSDPRQIFDGGVVLAFSTIVDNVQNWTLGVEEADPALEADIVEHNKFDKLNAGQVAIVVKPENSPDGRSKITIASTATLSPASQDIALKAMKEGDLDAVGHIVANSEQWDGVESPTFMQIESFGETGQQYLVYRSPTLNRLIRINEVELSKALNNKSAMFNFGESAGKDAPKDLGFKKVSAKKAEYDAVNISKDIALFLQNKKYQVDRALGNMNSPYQSRITGTQYDTYQDYLFSTTEAGERSVGKGHSSILATDIVRIGDSVFNNVGLEFSKGNVNEGSTQSIAEKVLPPSAPGGMRVLLPSDVAALMGDGINFGMNAEDIIKDELDQGCKG